MDFVFVWCSAKMRWKQKTGEWRRFSIFILKRGCCWWHASSRLIFLSFQSWTLLKILIFMLIFFHFFCCYRWHSLTTHTSSSNPSKVLTSVQASYWSTTKSQGNKGWAFRACKIYNFNDNQSIIFPQLFYFHQQLLNLLWYFPVDSGTYIVLTCYDFPYKNITTFILNQARNFQSERL